MCRRLTWLHDRNMLTQFPLQKERNPCSRGTLMKQSIIPLYLFSCANVVCEFWSWNKQNDVIGDAIEITWRMSLTLSTGAITVLDIAAAVAPAIKSLENLTTSSLETPAWEKNVFWREFEQKLTWNCCVNGHRLYCYLMSERLEYLVKNIYKRYR